MPGAVPLVAGQSGVWAAEQTEPLADAFLISQLVWFDDEFDAVLLVEAVRTAAAEADVFEFRVAVDADGAVAFEPLTQAPKVSTRLSNSAAISDEDLQLSARDRCRVLAGGDTRFAPVSVLHRRVHGGWAWEFVTHHIFLDAYGLGLFTRRVAEVYTALLEGSPVPERWFGSYRELVDASLPGDSQSSGEWYWRQKLTDVEVENAVGFDVSRQFFLPDARASLAAPEELADGVDRIARSAGVSWSDVVLTAWGLFAAAVDGRDVFAVRLPQMNRRTRLELTTPAMLVEALLVVLDADPSQSTGELLRAVRDAVHAGSQHVIADERIARLWPGGVVDYQSIPQVNVKAFDYEYAFGDVVARQETIAGGPAGRRDLMVYRDAVHGFRFDAASNDPALVAGDVEELLTQFIRFLGEFVASNLDTSVCTVEPAYDDATEAWSRGEEVVRPGKTLDALVQEQAERTPDTIAVIGDDETSLTYRTLDRSVNALTHLLIKQGVRVGDRVAVLLPRSVDLVVTLTAIIRAGAAYVPVDPNYPTERVRSILRDALPAAVIVDQATISTHRESIDVSDVLVFVVDDSQVREAVAAGASSAPVLARPLTPADAVYVIFTSGTSGRPKGVMLSHAAVVNRLLWGHRALGFTDADRILLKTPVTFDVSVPELFLPLIVGAAIVVTVDGGHGDPGLIARVLREQRITSVHFVPSMLQAFLDFVGAGEQFDSVRLVSFTGEALPPAAAREARRVFGSAELFNLYGPTEAAVEIGSYDIAGLTVDDSSTPIGRPIDNSSFVVLDSWLRPVAPGVIGELYLGGMQLADGYVGRYALTAERFIADPFSDSGQRLYRTGDLVQWNATGELEYLGRTDDQVKVRGLRIELDEIRNSLEQHDAVSGAAVVALDHPAGGKFLAAYLIARLGSGDESGLVERVRAHAARLLPDYMVPTTFTVLDAFPVSGSGKLDRRALPAPDLGSTSLGGRAPETDPERALADVFADALHLDRSVMLSADEDFFRLGGHSLLATRVVARANALLGSRLTLRDVFDHPTIAALAAVVDLAVGADALVHGPSVPGSGVVPRLRVGELARPDVVPVSFGQQSLWLIEQMGGPGSRYVVPTVLRLSGRLDASALQQAVGDVVARHEALRTLIVEADGQLAQVIVPADVALAQLEFAVEDLTVEGDRALASADADSVDARVVEVVQAGFDLATDIPVHGALLRVGTDKWVLVLAVHHQAIDEWSLPSLLEDLSTAYTARTVDQAPDWAPLSVQYVDYAIWQRETLGDANDPSSELAGHLDYWRGVLADAPEESTISLDRARLAEPTHRGEDITFTIDPETVVRLRAVAAERGLSMFILAHAATALTVSALGGGDDLVIGSPVGGRTEDGLEDLVGYFVNTLPIRHRLNPADTIGDLLDKTRQTVLDGFAHQAAPFEEITRALNVPRSVNRNPLFQIMLNHHVGEQDAPLVIQGMSSEPLIARLGAAKADLELDLEDAPTGVTGYLTYATDLFDQATAARFITALNAAFDALVSPTNTYISSLGLIPDEDQAQTGVRSAGESLDTSNLTVDALLRNQAARSPEAVAVIGNEGSELTYAQFEARVNAFAILLVEYGVGVGERVAVLLPRSADQVVTLAAIMRVGAGYVPIDPEYPAERVRNIVEDATPRLLITDQTTSITHAAILNTNTCLIVDKAEVRVRVDAGAASAPALSRPLTAADAAYVIFTSGTTGRPKGVEVSHGAVANRLAWGAHALQYGPDTVALAKSGVGFVDASTELFGPLASGGTVVVLSDETAKDPAALASVIEHHRVTHLLTVPTLGDALAHGAAADSLGSVRHWVSSGEALTPAVASAMHGAAPGAVLHNFYGSTEVTGDGTRTIVSPDAAVSIGGPVANTTARVLDGWLRPAPLGVIGELYLGGVQLAEGYVGKAALTAERFVADPFSSIGERLYRTGDLVRWNTEERLEYLGRADDQVKIRGFRIELDDIRSTIEQHEAVTAAAVVAHDRPTGGKFLACYLTTSHAGDESALIERVRAHTADSLPEYMIPTTFTVLYAFPVTPNGKLDRRALPSPDLGAVTSGGRAPETATEHAIAAVFCDVLHLDEATTPSVDDDFFRLGGDSILAARVVSQAIKAGLTIDLRDVFEKRTIAHLAQAFEPRDLAADQPAEPSPLAPSTVLERLRASGDHPDTWVLTELVAFTPASVGDVRAAFAALTDAHDALRVRVAATNRRLWPSEVLPRGATDPAAQVAEIEIGATDTALRAAAASLIRVTDGLPAALAIRHDIDQTTAVLAVHAAASDRAGVHALAHHLERHLGQGVAPATSASLAAALAAIDATGAREDDAPAAEWAELLTSTPAADVPWVDGGFAVFTVDEDDNRIEHLVRTALANVAREHSPDLVVDHEVSLATGDAIGPFAATVPVRVATDDGAPLTAQYPLLRFYNRAGRRTLRGAPLPPALITRQHGPLADPAVREGIETQYAGVIRISTSDSAATVTLLGFAPGFVERVTDALRAVSRVARLR